MIAIIDYGMGNVRSVFNGLSYIGEDAVITSDPSLIDNASHLILPGVGAFGDAIKNLKDRGLIDVLYRQVYKKGKPLLGICLGLQILAESSEEHGYHKGLGWFEAEVKRFALDGTKFKIPHVGWNEIEIKIKHPLFYNISENQNVFYFVHSYHINCVHAEDIAATSEYGYTFTSAIYKNNIIATQFHPEKSQDNGIQLLKNFVNWNP